MRKIYKTQFFRLYILTGIDLSDASGLKIIVKDPNNEMSEWDAKIDPVNPMRMYYDSQALNKSGKWVVYSKATFPKGSITGNPVSLQIIDEGKL